VLKATKKSDTTLKLSWKAVTGADKYEIYYCKSGNKFKKLATVSGKKKSTTISKLNFAKYDYKFAIRAYGEDGKEKYYSVSSAPILVK